jgi:PPOX class probable F420-dependent enzyme
VKDLGDERYVSVATFRRDGREVRTPVWAARSGERLYVYTNRTSGKVKRLKRSERVRLAACDARGKVRGDWVEGRARVLLEPAAMEEGLAAIQRKYGWQMTLLGLGARLSGRWRDRAVLEIQVP